MAVLLGQLVLVLQCETKADELCSLLDSLAKFRSFDYTTCWHRRLSGAQWDGDSFVCVCAFVRLNCQFAYVHVCTLVVCMSLAVNIIKMEICVGLLTCWQALNESK